MSRWILDPSEVCVLPDIRDKSRHWRLLFISQHLDQRVIGVSQSISIEHGWNGPQPTYQTRVSLSCFSFATPTTLVNCNWHCSQETWLQRSLSSHLHPRTSAHLAVLIEIAARHAMLALASQALQISFQCDVEWSRLKRYLNWSAIYLYEGRPSSSLISASLTRLFLITCSYVTPRWLTGIQYITRSVQPFLCFCQ